MREFDGGTEGAQRTVQRDKVREIREQGKDGEQGRQETGSKDTGMEIEEVGGGVALASQDAERDGERKE
jgi:hypothetical protein